MTTSSPAVLIYCPVGKTTNAGGTIAADAFAACTVSCDAGELCLDCRATKATCLDCGADAYLETTCKAHDATTRHPSCKKSWGLGSKGDANSCTECNDNNKILVPTTAASADGKTAASPQGMCKCKDGFRTVASTDAT